MWEWYKFFDLKAQKQTPIKHGSQADVTFLLWKVFSWFIEPSWMRVTKHLFLQTPLQERLRLYKTVQMPLVWGRKLCFTQYLCHFLSCVLPAHYLCFCVFYKRTSSPLLSLTLHRQGDIAEELRSLSSNQINNHDVRGLYFRIIKTNEWKFIALKVKLWASFWSVL